MRRGLSNNRAWLHKELGFLLLVLLVGCTIAPLEKHFDCGDWNEDMNSWYCQSRVTGKCIRNEYVDMEECKEINNGTDADGTGG
jgi:hypothetical protein